MTKGKYTKGFTLVELLVVIAIIAVLAGALFLVINPAQILAKSRDSRRVSDLGQLDRAIALGLAESKLAIITLATPTRTSDAYAAGVDPYNVGGTTGWVRYTLLGGAVFSMPTLPRDPSTNVYSFDSDATTSTWEINGVLESADGILKMQRDGGNAAAVYELGSDPGLDLI